MLCLPVSIHTTLTALYLALLTATFDRTPSFVRLKGPVFTKTGQDKVLSNR